MWYNMRMEKADLKRMSRCFEVLRKGWCDEAWDELWGLLAQRRRYWHLNWRIPGYDDEDLDQVLRVMLWQHIIPRWKPKGACSPSSWISLLMQRRYSSLLRQATLTDHAQAMRNTTYLTLELSESIPEPHRHDPTDDIVDLRIRMSKVFELLDGYLLQVAVLKAAGLTHCEIAKKLGRSEKSVENASTRIRVKARLAGI